MRQPAGAGEGLVVPGDEDAAVVAHGDEGLEVAEPRLPAVVDLGRLGQHLLGVQGVGDVQHHQEQGAPPQEARGEWTAGFQGFAG